MSKIDINCDMGEGFGLYEIGNDEEIMPFISSANIACGFHAGDPRKMRQTIKLAKKYNVQIGAHPGFPDLLGFGRRQIDCDFHEIKDYVTYQIGALMGIARTEKVDVEHVKPHGALYMQSLRNKEVARAILEAVYELDKNLIVYTLENSEVALLGKKMGMNIAYEGYSDCEHTSDFNIVPLKKSANIIDLDTQVNRVIKMILDKKVETNDGKEISLEVQTICIHGDTQNAVNFGRILNSALKENHIHLLKFREISGGQNYERV
jgi:5-oxoprolinase (ATP-hydrolysing) subunit A